MCFFLGGGAVQVIFRACFITGFGFGLDFDFFCFGFVLDLGLLNKYLV